MKARLQQWGNDLGVKIPQQFSKKLNLKTGSPIKLLIQNGNLVVAPQKYSLEQFLKRINRVNSHPSYWDHESIQN